MSKIIKGYFYINTGYVNCSKREDFEIEVPNDASEVVIHATLNDYFEEFLCNTDMGWVINEEE